MLHAGFVVITTDLCQGVSYDTTILDGDLAGPDLQVHAHCLPGPALTALCAAVARRRPPEIAEHRHCQRLHAGTSPGAAPAATLPAANGLQPLSAILGRRMRASWAAVTLPSPQAEGGLACRGCGSQQCRRAMC
jgi:hypothetical protein